ncbi:MAG TPA: PhzF family phenazine biosynthesis protein [Nevskiaceae bacterium]|nr:PhzF family phenazine biosynthesis protein [Nevskiaceae bacterium]
MKRPYHILDVFTRRAYAGNPLAVVLDAEGLDAPRMQKMAAAFNLSETVFVLPPQTAGSRARLRIFTPATELPFAGHPTIGTACLLASLDAAPGDQDWVLELPVGQLPIHLRAVAEGPRHARLTTAVAPERRPWTGDPAAVAAALGLEPGLLDPAGLRQASAGNPFLLVGLRQPETLAALAPRREALQALLAGQWAHGVYVVARGYEGEWRTRMFAPDLGVIEDPATGSAAAALVGALALENAATLDQPQRLLQGFEMGRPSEIEGCARQIEGVGLRVQIGGYAVPVASGEIRLPD